MSSGLLRHAMRVTVFMGVLFALSFRASLGPVAQAQTAAPFQLSATPSSQTVTAGGSTTYTVSVKSLTGAFSIVGLSVSGLPAGAKGSFNPQSVLVKGSASSTLTVSTNTATPSGSSTLIITGTSIFGAAAGSASTSVSLNVGPAAPIPSFQVTASPASQTVTAGGSTSYSVMVQAINGYNSSVTLAVSGLPSGAGGSFNPASVTPTASGASSTLTVTTSASTPAGGSTLTITGTGPNSTGTGSITNSTTVTLNVTAAAPTPSFQVTASPASQTVTAGGGTSYSVMVQAINGYNSSVALAVSGLPSGAGGSFNPASVTPTASGASSTLTVTTSASTPAGGSTLTITGTGPSSTGTGSIQSSASVTLNVTAASSGTHVSQISSDPFTNSSSMHQTEVEPDTFSNGSTIVSAFQAGRFSNGGASDIGWATSTDGGATWSHGFLPCITGFQPASNFAGVCGSATQYARVSDPAVAYDVRHGHWLIASLVLNQSFGGVVGAAVLVSASSDGLTWGNPVPVTLASAAVFGGSANLDKTWIVCDNGASSPFDGNCYVEFDDNAAGNRLYMSTSSDGGLTWGSPLTNSSAATGLGGQPVVQPNGAVIVPSVSAFENAIQSFRSLDGGASWRATVQVASVVDHRVAGNLRTSPLPSAEIDAAGNVYVVWQDCRFEAGCVANDIVLSSSADGVTWSGVSRVPIDAVGSGVDHFIPGLGVDKTTSGSSAHLGLTYYFYPQANCGSSCQLSAGFISSANGGASWSGARQLVGASTSPGPMSLSWLPLTTEGFMVGDYISTSIVSGTPVPALAVALSPSGATFQEATYTANGLSLAAAPAAEAAAEAAPAQVVSTESDHPAATAPRTRR